MVTVSTSGLVTAAGNGTATVTASSGAVSGSASAAVSQRAALVTVAPAADTMLVTDTVRLVAEARDANDFAIIDAEFRWESEDASVATIDSLGSVVAVGAGATGITATSDEAIGTAEILVLEPATEIADFVSGVQADGADVTVRSGSPPAEGDGPDVDAATSSLSIINGGTLQLSVESAEQFSVLYLFVKGAGTETGGDQQPRRLTPGDQQVLQLEKSKLSAEPSTLDARHAGTKPLRAADPLLIGGYYEIVLDEVASTVSLLLQFAQSLPANSFELLVSAAKSVGSLPGRYESFGLEATTVGTGDLQVSLSWDSNADLDLHVVEPSGEEIYWNHRRSGTGGVLDLDGNAVCRARLERNENITWPTGSAPAGRYSVRVNHWSSCGAARTNYVVRIELPDGRSDVYTGSFTGSGNRGGRGSGRTISRFEVDQAPDRVIIARVEPTPLIEGRAARIIGSGFSSRASRNEVLIGGVRAEVTDATPTRLSITIPQFDDCLPPRKTELSLTVGDETASRTVGVTPLSPDDLALPVGYYAYTFRGNGCLHLPGDESGGEYLIGVASTSEEASSLAPIIMTGTPGDATVAAAVVAAAAGMDSPSVDATQRFPGGISAESTDRIALAQPATGGPLAQPPSLGASGFVRNSATQDVRGQAPERDWQLHSEMMARGAALFDQLGRPRRQPPDAPASARSRRLGTGDTLTVRVGDEFDCVTRGSVRAVVRLEGEATIWLDDVNNPSGGFTAAQLEQLDRFYADSVRTVHRSYFGDVSDVDGNGRILILMTRIVNNKAGSSGWVWFPDLHSKGTCGTSNHAEIFFGVVPDPDGREGSVRSRDSTFKAYFSLLTHEITHLVQANTMFNDPPSCWGRSLTGACRTRWELEGGATLAEQLVAFERFGHRSGQDLGWSEYRGQENWYLWVADMAHFFGWGGADGAPEQCTWIGIPEEHDHVPCADRGRAIYGVPSMVFRYALDRWGGDFPGVNGH